MAIKPFSPKDGQAMKNIEIMFQVELSQVYCQYIKKSAYKFMKFQQLGRDDLNAFLAAAPEISYADLVQMFKALNDLLELLSDIFYRLNLDKQKVELNNDEMK